MHVQVLAVVSDGLTAQSVWFSLDCARTDLVYKVPNPYATDVRSLYFTADLSHLLKTVLVGCAVKAINPEHNPA